MTTFTDRLAVGVAFEDRIADELTVRGWAADRWGQGQLGERTRRVLQDTESLLRYEPDLVASRGDCDVVMIDCKASMRSPETTRRMIKRVHLDAAFRFMAERHLPFYYVFDDMTVVAPFELLQPGWPSPFVGRNSVYRVPDGLCVPFDVVFGRARRDARFRLIADPAAAA